MGYLTVFSVQDQAPADLTPGELAVILAIARSVRDSTGVGGVDEDTICQRSKLSVRGVGKALERLAERGYELRVPLSEDRRGRPVYAVRGTGRKFRIPDAWRPVDNAPSEEESPYPSTTFPDEEGRTAVPERTYPSTRKPVPQYGLGGHGSHGSQSVRAAVEYLCTEYGVTEDDGLAIWQRIQTTAAGPIRSPLKYAQRCVGEDRDKWHQAPAAKSGGPFEGIPWCGDCDTPTTRWVMTDAGVKRCRCSTPGWDTERPEPRPQAREHHEVRAAAFGPLVEEWEQSRMARQKGTAPRSTTDQRVAALGLAASRRREGR